VPPIDQEALPSDAREAVDRATNLLRTELADALGGAGIDVLELRSASFAVVITGLPDLRRAWERFRAARSRTGLWPVVIGWVDDFKFGENDGPLVDGDAAPDVLAWRAGWYREDNDVPDPSDSEFWIDVLPQHRFAFERGDINGNGDLALFPVQHGWEVLAATKWTDGNGLPYWVHRDVAKQWEQDQGAELAVIDGATVEFFMPTPVADREEAVAVAWEMKGYGDEALDFYELNKIASAVLVNSVWRFWWD
jgi:hypothetical protein